MKKLQMLLAITLLSLNGEASSSSGASTPYALITDAETHLRKASEDLWNAMAAYPEDSPYRKHLQVWNKMIVDAGKAIMENKKSYK